MPAGKSTAYDSITAAIAPDPLPWVPPEIAPECLSIGKFSGAGGPSIGVSGATDQKIRSSGEQLVQGACVRPLEDSRNLLDARAEEAGDLRQLPVRSYKRQFSPQRRFSYQRIGEMPFHSGPKRGGDVRHNSSDGPRVIFIGEHTSGVETRREAEVIWYKVEAQWSDDRWA